MSRSAPDASSRPPAPQRRGLLLGAAVGAGAAVVAARVAGVAAPQPAAAEAGAAPQGTGYRLTPHVRRYYETTRT